MTYKEIPHQDIDLGLFRRTDGQQFKITTQLYDMPATHDYWQATYDAEHDQWGHLRYVLTVPKSIAPTIDLARTIAMGSALDQVKSSLHSANASGRDLSVCFATDGWTLV